jgi:hypothetical protein
MKSRSLRFVAASLTAAALSIGAPAAVQAHPATSGAARDAACDQARTTYAAAKHDHKVAVRQLAVARKRLHQAHEHGTAADFQRAKNKVRKARGRVYTTRIAMEQAAAAVMAAC